MKQNQIITKKPEIVELEDDKEIFGEIKEITSQELGANLANIAKVTLWGADVLHHHKKGQETYYCTSGRGEINIDGQISDFNPGDRIIINPGTLHAVRPKNGPGTGCDQIEFLCVSAPAFDPNDVFPDKIGRNW